MGLRDGARAGRIAVTVLLLVGCTRSRQAETPAEGATPEADDRSARSTGAIEIDAGEPMRGGLEPAFLDSGLYPPDGGGLWTDAAVPGPLDAGPPPPRFNCEGPDAVEAAQVVSPVGIFEGLRAELDAQGVIERLPITIDPARCEPAAYFEGLPLGSAYAYVHPLDDGRCEVWLGGEHESPSYDGLPTGYCLFDPGCEPLSIWPQDDPLCGPAVIDSNRCTP